jgi:hypothetical protein
MHFNEHGYSEKQVRSMGALGTTGQFNHNNAAKVTKEKRVVQRYSIKKCVANRITHHHTMKMAFYSKRIAAQRVPETNKKWHGPILKLRPHDAASSLAWPHLIINLYS